MRPGLSLSLSLSLSFSLSLSLSLVLSLSLSLVCVCVGTGACGRGRGVRSACDRAGRWERALELEARMGAEGLRPNLITFNALISACRRAARPEEAFAVLANTTAMHRYVDILYQYFDI